MPERAPLSVTFYLEEDDASLFRALWPAQKGCRFDELAHRGLVDAGLLEIEPYNPGPNGECLDDVRLTKKGEREIVRLRNLADEGFKSRRATTCARHAPGSSAVERSSRRPAPADGGGISTGRPSSPVPETNPYRAQAGPEHAEGA